MIRHVAPLALLGFLATVTGAPAQNIGRTTPDLQFATEAASSGHAEVAMGHMAARKATRQDIRQFAQRMVKDHNAANRELSTLAARQHLRLPRQPVGADAQEVKQLSSLSGRDFDNAYINRMVTDHQRDVTAFRQEVDNGSPGPIRTLAESTLPMLEEHLKLAEDLKRATGEEKAQVPPARPPAGQTR